MNKNFNNTEELIADDSFLSWFFKTDSNSIAQWDEWITANPQKKQLVDEAVALLQQIQIQEKPVSNSQVEAAEARLMNAINNEKQNQPAKVISITRKRFIWYAAAAAIIALAFFGTRFLTNSREPQIATAFGEIKQKRLPDGTEVFLNANSNISYKNDCKENACREVWISGEAFFHVKKTAKKDKFTVHTDAFDIEVTGTSFNVVNRNGKSSVILKEGSVIIHRKGLADIAMVPGDMVEFSKEQIEKKIVQKNDYLAWTENKLVFDNTPISEVVNTIHQHYGVEVELKDNDLKQKTITGILPNNNLTVLLQALEATQDFEITNSDKVITIGKKN